MATRQRTGTSNSAARKIAALERRRPGPPREIPTAEVPGWGGSRPAQVPRRELATARVTASRHRRQSGVPIRIFTAGTGLFLPAPGAAWDMTFTVFGTFREQDLRRTRRDFYVFPRLPRPTSPQTNLLTNFLVRGGGRGMHQPTPPGPERQSTRASTTNDVFHSRQVNSFIFTSKSGTYVRAFRSLQIRVLLPCRRR